MYVRTILPNQLNELINRYRIEQQVRDSLTQAMGVSSHSEVSNIMGSI
jgi:hypothetical protein